MLRVCLKKKIYIYNSMAFKVNMIHNMPVVIKKKVRQITLIQLESHFQQVS